MTDNTQPEALMQLADAYAEASFDQGLHKRTLDDAPESARSVLAAAVRRLHAHCQELESQVIRDCMTHVQNPAEACTCPSGDGSLRWPCPAHPAPQQPAPAEATEEVENLRKALVYVAFALHDTPQYMLAQGIALIDGDTVRVSRDGWTVEASVNPHRQPVPATQQAGEVHGDLLPKIGSRVFIRHGRDEDAHACIVTGYYAWGDLKGDKRLHRVFVRMVYEGTSIEQARMLCDCYPTAGAALAATSQPYPTAQAAESVPAIQGETNAQLDTDSNPTAPGQHRNVAGSVALGQPMGHGPDQVAGHLGAQGDKLLTVAERNIRSFLRSAHFKSESDREAALNCVDVLWAAARAPADSVLEDAALSGEQQRAIFEAYESAASESYFEARPQIDCNDRRRVFKAGYERGWDAARKQGGA